MILSPHTLTPSPASPSPWVHEGSWILRAKCCNIMGATSVDCKWLFLALLALQDHCGLNSSCWAADATIRAAGALRWRSSSPSAEEVSSSEPTSAVKHPQVEEKSELTPSTAVEDQECTIPISKNQDPYVMGSSLVTTILTSVYGKGNIRVRTLSV